MLLQSSLILCFAKHLHSLYLRASQLNHTLLYTHYLFSGRSLVLELEETVNAHSLSLHHLQSCRVYLIAYESAPFQAEEF